jgi:hypothetical protein
MVEEVPFTSKISVAKFEGGEKSLSLNKIIRCFNFLGYDLIVFAVKRDAENET